MESITQLTDDRRPKGVHNSLQTDGPRIYFNEGTRGSLQIAQMAVTGGPVAIISTPPLNAQPVGMAPDGSWLLVLPGGSGPPPKPPWGIPLPTGEPNQIGTLEVQDGGITPDGRVLMARLGELYLTEKDGSNQRKIIGGIDGFIGDPNMSPDGQRIVFTSPSLRIIWREVHASRANRGLERLEIVYNNSGFAVTIQVKEAIERLLGSVHVGQGRLGGGTSGGTGLAGSGIEIGHFLNAIEGFD